MLVTRFAPSPTGHLHLGSAYAAIIAHGTARAGGGRFLLRIEDIDSTRCRPEYEASILEDLEWLGLSWDGPVWRQSERLSAYNGAIAQLQAMDLVYPCFCSRKEIAEEVSRSLSAPQGPDGPLYPGTCRALSVAEARERMQEEPFALRLRAGAAAAGVGTLGFVEQGSGPAGEHGDIAVQPELFGDVVLTSRDRAAAYHLAVAVDDAAQGVSLVTRGQDLFAATHVHRLLQALLGLPAPAYRHHRLILDEGGRKFSKRDRSVTLQALRGSGATPAELFARLGL